MPALAGILIVIAVFGALPLPIAYWRAAWHCPCA